MTDDLFTHPSRLCVSIRLTEDQTALIEQSAAAAGLSTARWAQRHLLAALGCLPAVSSEDAAVLTDIIARAAHLDSLLTAKQ